MKLSEFIFALFAVICLVANQVILKSWIDSKNVVIWPPNFNLFKSLISFEIFIVGILVLLSGLIWIYLLGKVQFSILYPIISLSYVLGILAAKFIFMEEIPTIRWIGVLIIILGVILVGKK